MIILKDVKKTYDKGKGESFSLNMSLTVPNGVSVGLVGKNAAGKSTTIKLILGLISAESGTVEINGVEARRLTAKDKQSIGVAFSESGFSAFLTLNDVVKILRATYTHFDEQEFRSQCDKMKLPYDKEIKTFSTGMKAKLRVLVAITHEAKILIMDEPTAGLDIGARGEILKLLKTYREIHPDCSMIVTSHISTDLEGICDDVYLIEEGQTILHESIYKILNEYAVLRIHRDDYAQLDKSHIVGARDAEYGYACLTDEGSYYKEKYPKLIIEKATIDDVILTMGQEV